MCEGSIHVAHRMATQRESLVVKLIPGHGPTVGLYPADPAAADQRLVCVRGNNIACSIKNMQVKQDYLRYFTTDRFSLALLDFVKANIGKDLQAKLYYSHGDWIQFDGCPAGYGGTGRHGMFPTSWLEAGTRLEIGEPVVNTDTGVAAIEKALEQPDTTKIVDKVKSFLA